MNNGLLIVFSGPSGVGKGKILEAYLKQNGNTSYSVSLTTRPPRDYERDGVDYRFISREEFAKFIAAGEMLEYTEYGGNFYGTRKKLVYDNLCQGRDVILEIEVKGAREIKERCPDAFFVFIMPPSFEELERRLVGRNTEDRQTVERRLALAKEEMQNVDLYDCVIVNHRVEDAVEELANAIASAKAGQLRNKCLCWSETKSPADA